MPRNRAWLWTLLAVGLLPWPTPAAAGPDAPAERGPDTLVGDILALRDALDNLSASTEAEAGSAAYDAAGRAYDQVVPHAPDLDARAAELLENYWKSLQNEWPHNASNVRDLARAAAQVTDGDLRPAAERWARTGTFITPGTGEALPGGGVRVPILLFRPPPGGVGAYDVRVRVDPTLAYVLDARVEGGDGEAVADAANGTARLAAFSARALAGAGTTAGGFLVLGAVDVQPGSTSTGGIALTVEILELADAGGNRAPAVSPDAFITLGGIAGAGRASTPPTRWIALGAVAVLAGGAAFAARKFLKT